MPKQDITSWQYKRDISGLTFKLCFFNKISEISQLSYQRALNWQFQRQISYFRLVLVMKEQEN